MGNKEKRNKIKFRIGKLTVVEVKGLGVVDTRNKKIRPIKQFNYINHSSIINKQITNLLIFQSIKQTNNQSINIFSMKKLTSQSINQSNEQQQQQQ